MLYKSAEKIALTGARLASTTDANAKSVKDVTRQSANAKDALNAVRWSLAAGVKDAIGAMPKTGNVSA